MERNLLKSKGKSNNKKRMEKITSEWSLLLENIGSHNESQIKKAVELTISSSLVDLKLLDKSLKFFSLLPYEKKEVFLLMLSKELDNVNNINTANHLANLLGTFRTYYYLNKPKKPRRSDVFLKMKNILGTFDF